MLIYIIQFSRQALSSKESSCLQKLQLYSQLNLQLVQFLHLIIQSVQCLEQFEILLSFIDCKSILQIKVRSQMKQFCTYNAGN